MSYILDLRERFGLSQEYLATYLCISRSLLNMAEAGKRELPAVATIKLDSLSVFAATQNNPPEVETPATPADAPPKTENKKLLRQATRYEILAYSINKQLEQIRRRYKQALNAMALANYLAAKQPTTTDEGDQLWTQLLQRYATKNGKRYGPEAQAMLQWKLDCYTYGITRAKELGGEE